jgi:predicted metal-dependent peptidase
MIHDDLSKIGKQLMFSEPFYGVFLSTLNKVIRKDVPTAGVCKNGVNYQLAVNEEFWNSLNTDKKKIGLFKHELLHICFGHLTFKDDFPDHELANVAMDIEINQYLTPDYYPTPDILLPSSFPELKLPLKAGAREYYRLLQKSLDEGTSPGLCELMDSLRSDGQGLHPTWKEFDDLSEADKKLAEAQLRHQIKQVLESSKDMGFVPSELKSYIDDLLEVKQPSYDWKGYFRRFFGSSSKIYTKKTRRKYNKRFPSNPALKIKPKKHVLVGIDTSGSVSDKDILEFFNEINHMYKTGINITIAEGDADVHNVYEYDGRVPETVTGRGGTDMNPFVKYFNEHRQYNSLIVLTDGYIPEKSVNTFKPMLMVLSSNGATVESVKDLDWGNIIKIQ